MTAKTRKRSKKKRTSKDINQEVTNTVIKFIEENNCSPWSNGRNVMAWGQNFVSKKEYNGINRIITTWVHGYPINEWLTYKQAKDLGGTVKQGEKSTTIISFRMLPKKELEFNSSTGKDEQGFYPFLRTYSIFNILQCEGIEYPKPIKYDNDPIAEAEKLIKGFTNKPKVLNNEAFSPCYNLKNDIVKMPSMDVFFTSELYYQTLFHELIHSTGHKNRLDRPMVSNMKSKGYSKEELIAELGAAFLCTEAGIVNDNHDNSAAYIQGWLKQLQNDKKFIFYAAQQAQKAFNHIKPQEKETAQKLSA